ncbi:hypothetical protein PoB_001552200 [Plakobranchus ocellatus]|uniref:Uncharacterized protein n=1 Tax=Plakobranchus ocellatus TaxID=259542 RepID=A0AAV3Z3C9_9GAST|nr:hypothetical protein PoB_001552200 [Plakobranchus ocellatus]
MGNGGYGIYFLCPEGSTTRICGPVAETNGNYECELVAVTEYLRVVTVQPSMISMFIQSFSCHYLKYDISSVGENKYPCPTSVVLNNSPTLPL